MLPMCVSCRRSVKSKTVLHIGRIAAVKQHREITDHEHEDVGRDGR